MKLNIILVSAVLSSGSLYASTAICPTTTYNNATADPTGCGVLITLTSPTSGTVSITGTAAYDSGGDDTTVGIINNSSAPISSVTLTASNGAFAFDGDGIQVFTSQNGVATGTGGATEYEGPDSTFNLSGIDSGTCSGTPVKCGTGNGTLVVDFSMAIAPGGSDYFSLDGDPSIASGVTVGSTTPEPATFGVLGAGLLGLAGLLRFRKAA